MHYLHNYDERKKFLKMSKEFWNPPVERFIIYIYITRGEGQRHGLEEAALRDLQVTLTAESTVLRRFQMVFIFPRVLRMKLRLFEFYISVLNLLSFINIHLEEVETFYKYFLLFHKTVSNTALKNLFICKVFI